MADKAVKDNKIPYSIKLLEKALEIEPNSFDICAKLGILNFKLNHINTSIRYFEKTILLKPNSSLGYSNLGIIYTKLKNKNLAFKNYLKAMEIDPKSFVTNYNLGNHYVTCNDLENAEKYYLISIELEPKNFYPYNNLFQLYDRSNNLKKLDLIISKIINVFGRISSVTFLEGIFEFRKKNYKKTIELFKDLEIDQKDFQRNALKTNILGKCYDFVGSYSEAYNNFSLSNNIVESFMKDKFDKNNYINLIKKKINFLSKKQIKINNKTNTYDTFSDPVFLIGFPRSGTTLLDTILRTHKSVKVLEEKSLVDELIIKLNKVINANVSDLYNINDNIIKECRQLYFQSRKNLIGFENNIIYVDKMPLNILYIAELNKIFPRAKFILAIRNPFDVILSCFMQPFVPNDAMSNFYNLKDTSEFYDLVMKLWKHCENNLNLDLHVIKYENVVNNFDTTIKNLIKFLNINWSDDLKYFYKTAENRGIIHTPSYNQVNRPLYKQSISRWKNYDDKFSSIKIKLNKWAKLFEY